MSGGTTRTREARRVDHERQQATTKLAMFAAPTSFNQFAHVKA
jgi:hypothetical protein